MLEKECSRHIEFIYISILLINNGCKHVIAMPEIKVSLCSVKILLQCFVIRILIYLTKPGRQKERIVKKQMCDNYLAFLWDLTHSVTSKIYDLKNTGLN